MGLDIYVGTWTRYYQRDWLTVIQQMPDCKVEIVRPPDPPDALTDPEEIRQLTVAWAQRLANALHLPSIGSEDASKPYFTDKPAWDGFGGLRLWAAYLDQNKDPRKRMEPVTTDNWADDPVLRRYGTLDTDTLYPQLLLGAEVWLPIDEPGMFRASDATGNLRVFGNCRRLLEELDQINAVSWNADATVREQWLRQGCDHASNLEAAAKFGWAVTRTLVDEAVRHDLPMLLDY